jgi:hypothetical protein
MEKWIYDKGNTRIGEQKPINDGLLEGNDRDKTAKYNSHGWKNK